MRKLGAFLVYLLAFAVILAGAGLFLGHYITNSSSNLRNVYIGDINVGGLTRDETEAVLVERGWQKRAETPLVVTTLRGENME